MRLHVPLRHAPCPVAAPAAGGLMPPTHPSHTSQSRAALPASQPTLSCAHQMAGLGIARDPAWPARVHGKLSLPVSGRHQLTRYNTLHVRACAGGSRHWRTAVPALQLAEHVPVSCHQCRPCIQPALACRTVARALRPRVARPPPCRLPGCPLPTCCPMAAPLSRVHPPLLCLLQFYGDNAPRYGCHAVHTGRNS